MKKYIESLLLLCVAAFTLTACSEEEGTNPGGDGNPNVVVYQYTPGQPYNADNDITLRFATNNKVEAVYYLAEAEADYNSHLSEMGEAGYNDYVVENGTQVEGIEGQSNVDVTLTDMMGTYYITAVAVSGNQKKAYTTTFTGLAWEDVVSGTYIFNAQPVSGSAIGLPNTPTTLQVCTTDQTLYRFKDLFGEGYSMKLNMLDLQGQDESGTYRFFRVPEMATPYSIKLTDGNSYQLSVMDIGYFQDDESLVTAGGYESGMYEDGYCFVMVAYTVSAGYLCYGYDYFVPNE